MRLYEFTYADMPTDRILNPLVKTIEALPFIGTGIFTFPRFTASALFTAHTCLVATRSQVA